MGLHLAEISRHVTPDAHAILVLDGAGWHGAANLAIPDNLTLLPLPPYSPELGAHRDQRSRWGPMNPVENVWQYLRQNQLSLRVWPDYPAIVETCCQAWNALMAMPDRVVRGDNHLGRSATTILAGGEGWREGVARPEA